ncbi:MAG TPA: hypothetical protein DCY42_05950 [Chloroflexi bacterium]|nr:hypothetical protein [Chloroflexota bacterium]
MSNKDVVLGYFKHVVNGKDFSALETYVHPDFLTGSIPYIGMGVGMDSSSGDKVLVNYVYSDGPSAGKLQVGDQIVFVRDGDRLLETFKEITETPWGWGGLGTKFTLGVVRAGQKIEIEITRGIVDGLQMALADFKESWERNVKQKTPDQKVEILQIIEEGDTVACLTTSTATHLDFDRRYLIPVAEFFKMKDGKIIENWSVGDNGAFFQQMGFKIEKSP